MSPGPKIQGCGVVFLRFDDSFSRESQAAPEAQKTEEVKVAWVAWQEAMTGGGEEKKSYQFLKGLRKIHYCIFWVLQPEDSKFLRLGIPKFHLTLRLK